MTNLATRGPDAAPSAAIGPAAALADDALVRGGASRGAPEEGHVSGELAIFYLGFLALTYQVAARLDPVWGTIGFAVLVVGLLAGALRAVRPTAVAADGLPPGAGLRVALALPPLIGLVSLSLPLARFDPWGDELGVALPTLVAAAAAMRALGYRRADVGLSWPPGWGRSLASAVVVPLGIGVGYLEYRMLPGAAGAPAVPSPGDAALVVPAAIALGFTAELVYRGILQREATAIFGARLGVPYVAALAVLPVVGGYPALGTGLAFAVALAAGAAALWTRSLLGVGLAHGLAILAAWVVFPVILGPAQVTP